MVGIGEVALASTGVGAPIVAMKHLSDAAGTVKDLTSNPVDENLEMYDALSDSDILEKKLQEGCKELIPKDCERYKLCFHTERAAQLKKINKRKSNRHRQKKKSLTAADHGLKKIRDGLKHFESCPPFIYMGIKELIDRKKNPEERKQLITDFKDYINKLNINNKNPQNISSISQYLQIQRRRNQLSDSGPRNEPVNINKGDNKIKKPGSTPSVPENALRKIHEKPESDTGDQNKLKPPKDQPEPPEKIKKDLTKTKEGIKENLN